MRTADEERWYKEAVEAAGTDRCAACGEINTFFDDCGFFYSHYNDAYVPLCINCGVHPNGDR